MARTLRSQSLSYTIVYPDDPEARPVTRRLGNVAPDATDAQLWDFSEALASLSPAGVLSSVILAQQQQVTRPE